MLCQRKRKALAAYLLLRRLNKRRHRWWVHPINQKRENYGEFHKLCEELKEFPDRYFRYFRMSEAQFENLHSLIEDKIRGEGTNYRKSITTRERLAVTLRTLATGNSFASIAFNFRLGETTVRRIVNQTCKAIQEILMPIYMPKLDKQQWEKISTDFLQKWQMPNCVGALDGKHVNLFAPKNSGSLYFNYKKQFSIVLLALADANYRYIMIDVGSYGSNSDGGIFSNSGFGKKWLRNSEDLDVPEDRPLPQSESNLRLPLVIVADEAFPLKNNILRPFPGNTLTQTQRIFNYRLSRARRVVENTFGITVHIWRILLKKMEVSVDFATLITVACCTLHNFVLDTNCQRDFARHYLEECEEEINGAVQRLHQQTRRNFARPTVAALDIRNAFAEWFNTAPGILPYQYERI